MTTSRPVRIKLDDLLLRHGAITEEQLQRAKEEQRTLGGDLGRALVDLGYITEDLLVRAWAHQLGISRVAPDTMAISEDLLQAIPVQVCERFGIIAVGRDARTDAPIVATSDPTNEDHMRAIAHAVGQAVVPAVSTAASIERGIRRHYYGENPSKAQEPRGESDNPFAAGSGGGSHPEYAALLARLEHLEQKTASREGQILAILRAIGEILVDGGIVTREDYLRRVRKE